MCMTVRLPILGETHILQSKKKDKFRHPDRARPRALRSGYLLIFRIDITRTIAGTVPDRHTHLIFQVYVCVDTVLVRYDTA